MELLNKVGLLEGLEVQINQLIGKCQSLEDELSSTLYEAGEASSHASEAEDSATNAHLEIEGILDELGDLKQGIEETRDSEEVDLDAIKKEVTNDILETIKLKLWDSLDSMFRPKTEANNDG
jgi:chromosome segregation ATPase|tara:strand:+ start:193 stop:558 length:366 start_codon:yes stop_codon:yes gene_type:complete